MTGTQTQVHGTAVAIGDMAVLLRGQPGAGKSDLALRLLDDGARLIADDRVDVTIKESHIVLSCPPPISGKIEARGIGIIRVAPAPPTRLALVVDLVPTEDVPRMPEQEMCHVAGLPIPNVRLAPFEASAPTKVRLALALVTGSRKAAT